MYEFSSEQPQFREADDENEFLDETTKLAALKVDRSVVALECFCGIDFSFNSYLCIVTFAFFSKLLYVAQEQKISSGPLAPSLRATIIRPLS